jgi:environmental stress-induced protein Ves
VKTLAIHLGIGPEQATVDNAFGQFVMHIVRLSDQRAMPWKNGGGVTYEVAVFPPGASLDTFDWRVSMARVESNGPFSQFPGIDRSLAIMQGDGLRLVVDGGDAKLGPRSQPLVFAGDIPVSAALKGGPIIDINVMTRRGIWRHRMTCEPLTGALTVTANADTTVMVVRTGTVRLGDEYLQPRDAVMLAAGERLDLVAEAPAEFFRIDLVRV